MVDVRFATMEMVEVGLQRYHIDTVGSKQDSVSDLQALDLLS